MPYASNQDLPRAIVDKYQTPHKLDTFREAFNNAYKEYGGNEATAFKVAHHAAQHLPHALHVPIPNMKARAMRPGGQV